MEKLKAFEKEIDSKDKELFNLKSDFGKELLSVIFSPKPPCR